MRIRRELEEKNLLLERVDKIKDDFLTNTTHELKTPLHGIIGIAESLPEYPEKVEENLKLIIFSARRLSGLVDDILDYSKMKNHDLRLNRKPVDVSQVTETVIALLKPLADAKRIFLVSTVPENLPLVLADEGRLIQIMQNLVGNAIKFTDEGNVVVSSVEKEDRFEISVSDTGGGIPADRLEDIFKPI